MTKKGQKEGTAQPSVSRVWQPQRCLEDGKSIALRPSETGLAGEGRGGKLEEGSHHPGPGHPEVGHKHPCNHRRMTQTVNQPWGPEQHEHRWWNFKFLPTPGLREVYLSYKNKETWRFLIPCHESNSDLAQLLSTERLWSPVPWALHPHACLPAPAPAFHLLGLPLILVVPPFLLIFWGPPQIDLFYQISAPSSPH